MDFSDLLHFAYECLYFLVVFGVFLAVAIAKGRQAIINIIISLYLALLLSTHFPYYERLYALSSSPSTVALIKLGVFIAFTVFALVLCGRIMPSAFRENKFESFGKKFLLCLVATALVMVYSFTVLPVAELLSPGTPLQTIFGHSEWLFWWLLAPLVVLFLLA